MTIDMNEIESLFAGLEPSRGGYGSELDFEATDGGVRVLLVAEWHARCVEPEALVTAVDGEVLTVDGERTTAKAVAEDLADWA